MERFSRTKIRSVERSEYPRRSFSLRRTFPFSSGGTLVDACGMERTIGSNVLKRVGKSPYAPVCFVNGISEQRRAGRMVFPFCVFWITWEKEIVRTVTRGP